MTAPENDPARQARDTAETPPAEPGEVVLLEDLVPRADVRGGRKIVLGQDTPTSPGGSR